MIDVIKYCEMAEHIKEKFGLEKSLCTGKKTKKWNSDNPENVV